MRPPESRNKSSGEVEEAAGKLRRSAELQDKARPSEADKDATASAEFDAHAELTRERKGRPKSA